uniref:HMA domain-containing protein n=1 Tax=Leersia perrieri TaxID=77586 RepID=A0A0D9WFR4_9ORYZ
MASESLQCKTLALRVSIHCEGCKKKVKKVLQRIEGVYRCDVDGRSNKATVTVTGRVSADTLIRKLRRAGKQAEQWPEEPKQQQQQQTSGSQCQEEETKNQAPEPEPAKSGDGEPAEKPASGDAAEPTSDQNVSPEEVETKKVSGNGDGEDATPPATEDGGTESNTHGNVTATAGDGGGDEMAFVTQQPSEPKRRRKPEQPPLEQEEKAGDATLTMAAAAAASSNSGHFPAAEPLQPVHVVSYHVARPSSSAAYYAPSPAVVAAAAPPPSAPPREHSYAYAYSPYYSQPSPYRYGYYSYYGGGGGGGERTPQRSSASPARNSYGDLFSDDNANSCSVM